MNQSQNHLLDASASTLNGAGASFCLSTSFPQLTKGATAPKAPADCGLITRRLVVSLRDGGAGTPICRLPHHGHAAVRIGYATGKRQPLCGGPCRHRLYATRADRASVRTSLNGPVLGITGDSGACQITPDATPAHRNSFDGDTSSCWCKNSCRLPCPCPCHQPHTYGGSR